MRPITVRWDGDLRFTADVRGHRVSVDQPRHAGGGDTGPMPAELVPTALGTCVALYVQQFLVTRGLDASGLTVAVTTTSAANPSRLGRFDVHVTIPAGIPDRYRDAVRRAAEGCTVHHTLTYAPEIAVEIAAGVPTTAA